MRIYNSDTALATLTVSIANGANRYPIGKWVLAIGSFIDVLVTPSGALSNNDRLSNLANPESTISAAATASTAQWNRCYATSAAYALTLPPVLASAGKIVGVRIDSSSTYNVTVTGNSTDLIDGSNTYLMIPKECCEFKSDGTTWQRISNNTVSFAFTPVPNGFTVVNGTGGYTYTGMLIKSGNKCDVVINATPTGTATISASSGGASYYTIPITAVRGSVTTTTDNYSNNYGTALMGGGGSNMCVAPFSAVNHYIYTYCTIFLV
jgi:hypothetical protein